MMAQGLKNLLRNLNKELPKLASAITVSNYSATSYTPELPCATPATAAMSTDTPELFLDLSVVDSHC